MDNRTGPMPDAEFRGRVIQSLEDIHRRLGLMDNLVELHGRLEERVKDLEHIQDSNERRSRGVSIQLYATGAVLLVGLAEVLVAIMLH